MKTKLKNYLKTGFLIIGILFLLSNCEKENLIDVTNEAINQNLNETGTEITNITHVQVPEIVDAIAKHTGDDAIKLSFKGTKSIHYKKAFVDLENILKVKDKDNITNYTFGINVEGAPVNEFYNLVVNVSAKGKIKDPYVVRYVVDEDALDSFIAHERDFMYFKGLKSIIPFDSFFENYETNFTKLSSDCPNTTTTIDNTALGVSGGIPNIGPHNIIQTDPTMYNYQLSSIFGVNYSLYLNSIDANTGQQTSYGNIVTNQSISVTVQGVSPFTVGISVPSLNTINPPNRVIVNIIPGQLNVIVTVGVDGNTKYKICYTTVIIEYKDGHVTEVPLNNCLEYDEIVPNKASTTCPEPSGEIGIITSASCPSGYVKDILGLCAPIESINNELSEQSPYKVDMSKVLDSIYLPTVTDSMKIASEKFLCAYKKLTTSNSFKNLFINTFGSSQNFNVTFEITDLDDPTAGETGGTAYFTNGNFSGIDITIKIDEAKLRNGSNFSATRTILHESIHAYLKLKLRDCNAGTSLDYIDNLTLGETIKVFYDDFNCNPDPLQGQHEFMFDYMLPTFQTVFTEIGNLNFMTQGNINGLNDNYDLMYLNNPIDPNGIKIPASHIFNWDEFYFYNSLPGLHNTEAFKDEIENNNEKNNLYKAYKHLSNTYTKKDCN